VLSIIFLISDERFSQLYGFIGDILNLPQINWNFLSFFSIIAVIGVFAGIHLNRFLDGEKLKKVFGYFVLAMAMVIIIKELFI
jgi:uncharacterized membrane protein YfcA